MKRKAFTMVELISVIVIIGILSSMAIPKFSGIKDQANRSTELATAASISAALEAIHGNWSISDGDFDWNNDGVDDPIETELAESGYPIDLKRNGDAIGALIKSSSKSGFKKWILGTMNYDENSLYNIFTAKASNPTTGVKFTSQNSSKDIEGKPDRNDFWLYMIDTNSTNRCYVSSSLSKEKQIMNGDFMLIDINGSQPTDFSSADLGMAFKIECPS
jgi:prepilin-type N-terminal cleavage/methylation domain-containing protein